MGNEGRKKREVNLQKIIWKQSKTGNELTPIYYLNEGKCILIYKKLSNLKRAWTNYYLSNHLVIT